LALQGWVLAQVIRGSWSGDGALGPLRGMLAWSPWPSALVVVVGLAALATAAATAVEARRA
jgi:hypothetical protein